MGSEMCIRDSANTAVTALIVASAIFLLNEFRRRRRRRRRRSVIFLSNGNHINARTNNTVIVLNE